MRKRREWEEIEQSDGTESKGTKFQIFFNFNLVLFTFILNKIRKSTMANDATWDVCMVCMVQKGCLRKITQLLISLHLKFE